MLRREQSRLPGKRKETMLNRNMRNTAILLVVFLAVYMFGNYFAEKNLMSGSGSSSYSYERLESDIAKNKVKSIEVVQNAQVPTGSAIVKLNDGEKKVAHVTDVNKVIDLAQQYKVSCQVDDVKSSDAGWLSMILPWIVIGVIMMFMFGMISRASGGGGGGNKMMNFGKSRAKMLDPESQNIRFDQVAGLQEEKEELKEIVDFLKSPQKYIEVGARIPKGVILVGPPGTGKTLLAKAVSGEAGVPFFSISGSDFVEMFVGVGASRVRDLFEDAKRNAPCIVFIDEIDAVARRRGTGLGGGHDEREQTLNQLLVEMDGFGSNEGIITLAATNRPDILDPALLRPGRFDRRVVVGRPDLRGRIAILRVHARNKPLEPDVDLPTIAKKVPGFTGADLANMLNEAALLAARDNRKTISMADLEEASEKVSYGPERKSHRVSDEERKLTAYHESGHAIMATLLKDADPVHKVTIIPRGQAGGYTMMLPHEERSFITKSHLLAQIRVALGGRCAEKIIFNEISSGASGDLQQVTSILRKMIMEWGMSDRLGPMIFGEHQEQIFLGKQLGSERNYGETVATIIDEEMHKYLDEAYNDTMQALTDNLPVLHAMAKALMEVETINHTQVENLFKYHSIYAPGEEPKKDDTDSSDSPLPPAPSDDSPLPPVFGE